MLFTSEFWNIIASVTTALGFVVVIISSFIALRSLGEMKNARNLGAMLRAHELACSKEARHFVHKKILMAVIFGIILVACSSGDWQTATPGTTLNPTPASIKAPIPAFAYDTEKAKEVDALFEEFISSNSAGGAVIVIHEGEILYEAGYGLADLENDIPITPQHIFHLGSIGKQFTALGIMILAEQGDLDYDDPIGKYLPELARFGEELTIRHLMHHISGIPDYYEDENLYRKLLESAERPTNEEALALLREAGELQFDPGERFSYSNTGYEMLGSLIEQVSGQSYDQFVREQIFNQLGMDHTFSVPNPARIAEPNLAYSYSYGRWSTNIEKYDSDPLDDLIGSGSIYSTIGDMYRFDQALYTDNLIDPSYLVEAFKPGVLNNGKKTDYGFAWILGPSSRIVGHSGAWLGYVANYVRYPEQHFSIIVLFNRNYDLPDLEGLMLRIADIYDEESK